MGIKKVKYDSVRNKMRPGDVIAFSGNGEIAQIIKLATRSQVSHAAVILQTKLLIADQPQGGYFNQIIESTLINGFYGVSINRLSDRLVDFDGEIWWLPLSNEVRAKMNGQTFYDFLLHQEKKPFDTLDGIKSSIDIFDKIPLLSRLTRNNEDFASFFCSELVAAGLEASGAIPRINASEVTPIDLCMFSIYQENYYQIKGDVKKTINGYNSINVADWGINNP